MPNPDGDPPACTSTLNFGARRSYRRRGDTDALIREIAAPQHGVVSRSQLVSAGVPVSSVEYRVRKGILHRLHEGVYRVGAAPQQYERETAAVFAYAGSAVLSCAGSAVLSHRTAARLWSMLPEGTGRAPVELSVQRSCRSRMAGLLIHRVRSLPEDERTSRYGIPITSPARTLLDLAGCMTARELERALGQAYRSGLADQAHVAAVTARYPGRPGTRRLQALLADATEPAFVRSEAEERFLRLMRVAGLPAPRVNVRLAGHEVDFAWREARLVVEIDGAAFHSAPPAFECDRRRDAALVSAGFRVMRVTWKQLSREPEALLVRVAQALVTRRRE